MNERAQFCQSVSQSPSFVDERGNRNQHFSVLPGLQQRHSQNPNPPDQFLLSVFIKMATIISCSHQDSSYAVLLTVCSEYCKTPPSLAIVASNKTIHDSAGDFHGRCYPSYTLGGHQVLYKKVIYGDFYTISQLPGAGLSSWHTARFFIRIRGFQDPGFYLFQHLVFLLRSMGYCVHCQ